MRDAAVAAKKPSFDFKLYMADRAQIIDAALDKSVPLQYPEVINEAMRYSLLAGGCWRGRQAWHPGCMGAGTAMRKASAVATRPCITCCRRLQVAGTAQDLLACCDWGASSYHANCCVVSPHPTGGKRVRPALCLAACELVGGTIEQVRGKHS